MLLVMLMLTCVTRLWLRLDPAVSVNDTESRHHRAGNSKGICGGLQPSLTQLAVSWEWNVRHSRMYMVLPVIYTETGPMPTMVCMAHLVSFIMHDVDDGCSQDSGSTTSAGRAGALHESEACLIGQQPLEVTVQKQGFCN